MFQFKICNRGGKTKYQCFHSGDNQICVGESSVLTASGGSSYIWSTGQTTPSISVSPSSTTSYSVTVTNADACNGSDDFTVTVLPLPDITISGKDTICVGECTTLTASGGVTYQWNVPSNADCDGGYFIGGQQNNGPQSSTDLLLPVPFNSSVPQYHQA